MLDTVVGYETPEGALLKLRPAGAPVRALAWTLDLLIRTVLMIVLGMLAAWLGDVGTGFFLVALFLIDWFYNVLFEVFRGATPGKQRLGLLVVNDNGTPVTWSASILRNLLRVVDFLPLGYALGLLWSLFDTQSKRLGDLAAGTLVVYRDAPAVQLTSDRLDRVPSTPPPLALDYPVQQAIMAFAERSDSLAPARQVELAELMQPLHGQSSDAAVDRLLGYARYISGR